MICIEMKRKKQEEIPTYDPTKTQKHTNIYFLRKDKAFLRFFLTFTMLETIDGR